MYAIRSYYAVKIDASSKKELVALLKQSDAAIDMLPINFMENIFMRAKDTEEFASLRYKKDTR